MSSEDPKVRECWVEESANDGVPTLAGAYDKEHAWYRPAILIWKEDYDAMRNERTLNLKAIHELQASLAEATKTIAERNAEVDRLNTELCHVDTERLGWKIEAENRGEQPKQFENEKQEKRDRE